LKININNLYQKKQEQIRTMFFTLKILALFFSTIPIFQFFSKRYGLTFSTYNYSIFAVGSILVIVCAVMFFLMFIFNKKEGKSFYRKSEMVTFFIVFIFVIFLSGSNESYYKFLFLFLIVSYTIEYGMRTGIIIATISSVIILGFDVIFDEKLSVNVFLENDMALISMFFLVAWTLGFYVRLEQSHIQHLTEYANIDGLTGVYNHRYFYDVLDRMCISTIKKNSSISLIMFDIDYFKKYNDIYGHQKGDELLKELTSYVTKLIRPNDILCRYGGDEFSIILPDTDKPKASQIAKILRESVYNSYWIGEDFLPNKKLTISVGVSTLNNTTDNYNTLIENADSALYRAKFLRKNKVEVYSSIIDQFKEIDNVDDNFFNNLQPLKALITVINSRDTYTFKHVERVFNYCSIMADSLNLSPENKKHLMYGAYLHDLGKINISKEILVSDSNLTPEEWEELKRHPQDSADIIKQISGFEEVVPIVLQHHEKYNGTGYPNHLAGDEICYLARILTVADSFDAMTNQRPYQKTKTFEEAFEEIRKCSGVHFDPDIAEKFIEVIKSL